ncbi:MAG TPA: hypothetical protein VEB66_16130 [Opitutaceae bacterium]|nr:hypothetical protein [Opitutaceae bacterium]
MTPVGRAVALTLLLTVLAGAATAESGGPALIFVAALKELPAGAVALVVNHSGNIPALVEQLGAPRPRPVDPEEFDRLIVIARMPDGPATAAELRLPAP